MKGPSGRRPQGDSVTKALFAMSGNVCAFADPDRGLGCEQRLADPAWESVQAIICHIHGWSPGGPRYVEMPDEERNAFENLILLCPNHSNLIDRVEPDLYPAEKLIEMKRRHESRYGSGPELWRPSDAELDRFVRLAVSLTRSWIAAVEAAAAVVAVDESFSGGDPTPGGYGSAAYGSGTYGGGALGASPLGASPLGGSGSLAISI